MYIDHNNLTNILKSLLYSFLQDTDTIFSEIAVDYYQKLNTIFHQQSAIN